jgi:hypothetical protein
MIIDMAIDQLVPSLIPSQIHVADDAFQQASVSGQSMSGLLLASIMPLGYLVASFVGIAGLYFFRRWSLWLNVALIVVTPVIWFSIGYSLSSWVSGFLSQWTATSIGFALALAYFTPLKSEFR